MDKNIIEEIFKSKEFETGTKELMFYDLFCKEGKANYKDFIKYLGTASNLTNLMEGIKLEDIEDFKHLIKHYEITKSKADIIIGQIREFTDIPIDPATIIHILPQVKSRDVRYALIGTIDPDKVTENQIEALKPYISIAHIESESGRWKSGLYYEITEAESDEYRHRIFRLCEKINKNVLTSEKIFKYIGDVAFYYADFLIHNNRLDEAFDIIDQHEEAYNSTSCWEHDVLSTVKADIMLNIVDAFKKVLSKYLQHIPNIIIAAMARFKQSIDLSIVPKLEDDIRHRFLTGFKNLSKGHVFKNQIQDFYVELILKNCNLFSQDIIESVFKSIYQDRKIDLSNISMYLIPRSLGVAYHLPESELNKININRNTATLLFSFKCSDIDFVKKHKKYLKLENDSQSLLLLTVLKDRLGAFDTYYNKDTDSLLEIMSLLGLFLSENSDIAEIFLKDNEFKATWNVGYNADIVSNIEQINYVIGRYFTELVNKCYAKMIKFIDSKFQADYPELCNLILYIRSK